MSKSKLPCAKSRPSDEPNMLRETVKGRLRETDKRPQVYKKKELSEGVKRLRKGGHRRSFPIPPRVKKIKNIQTFSKMKMETNYQVDSYLIIQFLTKRDIKLQ